MSEKIARRYEAVFGRTLDEVAVALESAVNKLIQDGYTVHPEPKVMPVEVPGFGYILHAALEEPAVQAPQMAVMTPAMVKALRKQFLGGDNEEEEENGLSEKAD